MNIRFTHTYNTCTSQHALSFTTLNRIKANLCKYEIVYPLKAPCETIDNT